MEHTAEHTLAKQAGTSQGNTNDQILVEMHALGTPWWCASASTRSLDS